jgi:hypothetical protein
MRPFTQGFRGLPVAEKRRLVAERFTQIKVRDGRVVSLYLLTGEVKAVPARPEENCHSCGCVFEGDDLDQNLKFGVHADVSWRFCTACLNLTPQERAKRQRRYRRSLDLRPAAIQQVRPVADTSAGL